MEFSYISGKKDKRWKEERFRCLNTNGYKRDRWERKCQIYYANIERTNIQGIKTCYKLYLHV